MDNTKKKIKRIDREDALLVLIDFQERLLPAMANSTELEDTVCRMAKGAKTLGLPILVTQQYTRGLGNTVNSLSQILEKFSYVEKSTFSAFKTEEFKNAVEGSGKRTIILTGIETHICVEQTALDLLEAGYNVVLLADCVESRNHRNTKISVNRMRDAGAVISNYESVLYEMLTTSKAAEFKDISNIVK